jgi:hypothetical protein
MHQQVDVEGQLTPAFDDGNLIRGQHSMHELQVRLTLNINTSLNGHIRYLLALRIFQQTASSQVSAAMQARVLRE